MKDLDSTENKKKIVLLHDENIVIDNASENQPIRLKDISAQDKLNLQGNSADYIFCDERGFDRKSTGNQKNGSHNLTQLHNFRSNHK